MSSALVASLALIGATFVWRFLTQKWAARERQRLLAKIPHVDLDGDKTALRYVAETGTLMAEGYAKYTKKGLPFTIPNLADFTSPIVILPLKYLDEVALAPQSQLSLQEYFSKLGFLQYTGGPPIAETVQQVARTNLNRALNDLTESLQTACTAAFAKDMPECKAWTSLQPYNSLMSIFVRMGALVLVGPDLHDEWVALSFQYLPVFTKATRSIGTKYNAWTRWLAKYTDADVKSVLGLRRQAGALLRPVIQERMADGDSAKHIDAIQWLVKEYEARGDIQATPDELTQNLLVMTISSTHQTTMIALWILFDLIDHQRSLDEIKNEILHVQQGLEKGVWTRRALGDLRIMDSFMTETMRVHSFAQTTVNRMVMKPYTFKDGLLHLPPGTQLSFPTQQYSHDPDIHNDPDVFDPKRHLTKREKASASGSNANSNKYNFASTADSLNWGSGPHACPGRFLVQDALKLIFVHLLAHYDFMYPQVPGDSKAETVIQRPKADMSNGIMTMPDITASILFREKKN